MDAKKALEKARALEKQGLVDAAVQAFREAGAVDDAARVLGANRRQKEAGHLLLESLRVLPNQVGQLDSAGKKRALMAAILLGKAAENELAVQIFLSLGEQQRAVEVLQRAGDPVAAAKIAALKPGQLDAGPLLASARPQATAVGGQALSADAAQKLEQQGKLDLALQHYAQLRRFSDAARVAGRLGRHGDAAQLFADAGQPFEAAEAYLRAGDTGKALDNLARVPRDDGRYRAAAVQAIRLASDLGTVDFKVEHFLGPFVSSGPRSPAEMTAFELLAQLYVAHDMPGNAKEALEKVLAADPSRGSARERLEQVAEALRPSAAVARKVLEDGGQARRKTILEVPSAVPDLGELPALDLPPPGATLVKAPPPAPRSAAAGEQRFVPGATVAGRYRLEEKLGQGGMGSVWKAWDLELEEHVALKVFDAAQTSDALLQRFRQELKLSRQLVHPNVIRLYDIGVHEGHRYISMELLVGETLKERMRSPIPLAGALSYLVQACHGLQAAHEAGVIHRDVKPENLFITEDGVLKVMDFGIAKQHAAPGVTIAGSIAGTPLYMSPEQVSNFSQVNHLTDLYALGVCAYEMFTGTVPFSHADLVPLLMMHVNQPPEPPRRRNQAIPVPVEAIILRLLDKDPSRRFQSCRELASALESVRLRSA